MKKYITIIVILAFIILAFLLLSKKSNISNDVALRCPESYLDEQDKANALALFYARYISSNPKSDIGEIAQARVNFLIENKCTETLKAIEKNGGIKEYINNIVSSKIN